MTNDIYCQFFLVRFFLVLYFLFFWGKKKIYFYFWENFNIFEINYINYINYTNYINMININYDIRVTKKISPKPKHPRKKEGKKKT